DDFVLEGAGASVRGSVEVDSNFEVVHASFPSFALSDGDKTSLRADRTNDGVLKVVMRGDLYDGRGFVKNTVSGEKPDKRSKNSTDLDLDVKVGAVTGHHGEALRGIDLRLTRRNGQIRTLAMNGKIGSIARVSASLRPRGNGRQVVVLESSDAGALFRFTDTYARVFGGNVSIAMDAPTADGAAQEGLINVHDFTVRGEPALESVASSGSAPPSYDRTGRARPSTGSGVSFSRMRVEFTRSPGRFTVRDGVVWGPSVGATMDGYLDYSRDEVRLRGTFVPAYALNNMFGRLPIVGLFLGGGSNEGLLGITYQVVGSPQRPMLQVNPMSAVAPGFLRKLFEFRGGNEEQSLQMPDVTR
ncbi:MAG: AsmA-like C-terminal region-containing protein, partial [Variibacter sp.]